MISETIAGIRIPDSRLAREAADLVRDTAGNFLFEHSTRVYLWGALAGQGRNLRLDAELFYVAALFHDMGLTTGYRDSQHRFEVDGANAARAYLRGHGIADGDIERVWLAIALHTTPGISQHLQPIIALTAEGVMMDLVGLGAQKFTEAERHAVETAYPHPPGFAEDLLQTLYEGLEHRPGTTQGTGLADVMADKNPRFHRRDFCSLMRTSCWVTGHQSGRPHCDPKA
jgi:hypothetical protein